MKMGFGVGCSAKPPEIKSFINAVTAVPLDQIHEPLASFRWEFGKGDFHHWVDLFNHFDTYFEKHIKGRKDLHIEEDFEESGPPFPKDAVLQVLRVIRIVLENCSNKHFYSSYEQHLSLLLASTDADVVEACLQTLAAFLKRQIGKYSIRDASLNSKLFSLAQGWGGKEEGLGLTSCATENSCDQVSHQLGSTLHFEFYASNESSDLPGGLQVIHVPDVSLRPESDVELLNKLVIDHNVPPSLRFALLTRLRFARAFPSLSTRQQYTCIRLYAVIVLVQASGDTENVVSFFNGEPEFVNELVTLVSYEDSVPERIRILCLLSLVALSQDRTRQPTVLIAVTSGGHRALLSGLMQKAIDSVIRNTSKLSLAFAEALLSLVTVLVSSSSGCSAMREAGLIPTLVPLIKDTDPQHLHLVSTAVHILEAFMDYSNPAAALFRDLGGLDDTIFRLKLEVSRTEDDAKEKNCNSDSNARKLLLKALLRAISLGTYAPGNTNLYGSEESLLPECLCIIFRRAKDFGGGVFSLAATVMSDLIHKDPTCFNALDSAGLTSAFLDAICDEVICSAEAITCIPQCLDALCLNSSGLQAVKDRNALRCFIKIFTSSSYLRALTGDTPGSLSSGLDELLRHQSSLRTYGVDMFIEILNSILIIGSGMDATTSVSGNVATDAATVPMEIDADEKSLAVSYEAEPSSDTASANIELFLPDCVCNVARLFETVLQNAEVCSLFVEKKGIDAVLKLFCLPLMPLSASLGQGFSVAFKKFSPQHSAGLSRTVCSYLREHLNTTNELLLATKGTQLLKLESAVQMKILRSLSCLESMLSLSNFLLKGTSSAISELSAADADVLKALGITYREIIWQMALSGDTQEDETKSVDGGPDNSVSASSSTTERENDEDSSNASTVRCRNPISIRSSSSQSLWRGDREYMSVVRAGEGIHGRTRHAVARMRGGRARRHLEPFNFDSEIPLDVPETSSHELNKKSTKVLVVEILDRLNCTLRYFFTALVKGFTSANRRRIDGAPLSSASKTLGTALAKVFLEALNFVGYSVTTGLDSSLSVKCKCRYLGKVVDDMTSLTFDSRRRVCFTAMVNSFYVHGTFKQLLTTFEATSQLLWTVLFSIPASGTENEKPGERNTWSHSAWLVDTLQNYCRALDYFVNSTALLSPAPTSQTQLLVQQEQASIGLSIGLFPVPREPETFVRVLQSQVLDVILPLWNHPMFPNCNPNFVASVTSLVTHIYSGVVDATQNRSGATRGTNQRALPLQLDETIVGTIVEMGFSRSRAEEALRRVGTNNVEMAMEWLFTNSEDPVQEDNELAQALALSLGNASETPKLDGSEKLVDVLPEELVPKNPSSDEVIAASVKLFQSDDSMAFPLMDLFVTLCSRNKGEDRPKIMSYLIQQLKLVQLDFSKDAGALTMIPHILALVLSEDDNTREIAAQDGIVTVAIDILMEFKLKSESGTKILAPKCISALLLILSMMLQAQTRISSENVEENQRGSLKLSGCQQDSAALKKALSFDVANGESNEALESLFGKPTGYLTMEEGRKALLIACDLIKQCVPAMIMQAALQLCARLTKSHALAILFLEYGGLSSLFNLPKSCFFPGYDTFASVIVRHLVEDPQTLQIAMESEIRQTLCGKRHIGKVLPLTFLTTMAPVISRDPVVFMKAVASTCLLESSGGRDFVILSKEKEKPKVSGSDHGLSLNEPNGISENKLHDGSGKCSKSHRRVSPNFIQVIDQLIDIVLSFPGVKRHADVETGLISMEVDEPAIKVKGKSKVGDPEEAELGSEKSEELARVTFILKLLSDIVLMYLHGAGVILRQDTEISQLRGANLQDDSPGNGGLIYHVIHRLLPISLEKFVGPEEWKEKLSEKASWFLVVLCSRSSEGRRRIICELSRVLSAFASLGKSSSQSVLLPDKRVLAFAKLVYSILMKNSSSSNLPGCGCSPDVAKSMIDGGTIQCLTSILHVIDLDHPDAPKLVTLILKSLETLTRAANTAEQLKSEGQNGKRNTDSIERHDSLRTSTEAEADVPNQNNGGLQQVTDAAENGQELSQVSSQSEGERSLSETQAMPQEMRIEGEAARATLPEPIQMDFMREEIEGDQIEMSFHVENRDEDDGDDDMGDEGEEDDEDADLVEDGAGVMSLAGTDVEDAEDAGLQDEYNDDMIDEDEDDFHENRVIEVRWREALDGLDHFQILGRSGGGNGFIDDITAEPFEGVNVDDLFALRRPLGFERRRQTGRSFDRSASEVHGFQHPLFSRPLQTSNTASVSASAGSLPRQSEAGNYDVAQFYMFDTPVLPFDQVPGNPFSDRSGGSVAPPPLTDYSVMGMDSSRRGVGDSRWTDIGHPQPSNQSASIAQLIEEHFISNLRVCAPADTIVERESNSTEVQGQQQHPSVECGAVLGDSNDAGQQNEAPELLNNHDNVNNPPGVTAGSISQDQANLASPVVQDAGECPSQHELMQPPPPNSTLTEIDGMEVGEGDGVPIEQAVLEAVNHVSTAQVQSDTYSIQNVSGTGMPLPVDAPDSNCQPSVDVDMSSDDVEGNHSVEPSLLARDNNELPSMEATQDARNDVEVAEGSLDGGAPEENSIDPTFLDALPEDLRAEVLASQQAQSVQPPTYEPPAVDDIDPEFLAALPPDIQTEVLAQQRAQRMVQQSQGQPVDMDNASIIATLPADLREEVLLTSSEAVLAALPSPLLAEARMLRDRAMSHYQARNLFGSSHRLSNRRNGLGYNRLTGMDRGVGVSIGQRTVSSSADGMRVKEMEGTPLVDADALKSLIRLLRLAQPLGKGLLQRLLFNLCAHSVTRANLVQILLDMIRPEMETSPSELALSNPQRLYGCQSNVVYGRSQLLNGLPPLVFRRVLEVLTYLATNHSAVADMLFYFDPSLLSQKPTVCEGKGKEKVTHVTDTQNLEIPLVVFLKLLNRPQLLQSTSHLALVMGLLQVIVYTAASRIEGWSPSSGIPEKSEQEAAIETQKEAESELLGDAELSVASRKNCTDVYNIFLQLPESDLCNLCILLGYEGLSDKIYSLAGEVLKKLAAIDVAHRKFFIKELSQLASGLSASTVRELATLSNTQKISHSTGSMAGASILRVLQVLSSLTSPTDNSNVGTEKETEQEEQKNIMQRLNFALEPLWQELSQCISMNELQLDHTAATTTVSNANSGDHVLGVSPPSSLPPGTQRLLPLIEAFFVLCEKIQTPSILQQDNANATAGEVNESAHSSSSKTSADSQKKTDGSVTFSKFAEKHRRLLNSFVRQNPSLLEKSLSVMLKAPRLLDFDNKKAYFRSRIRHQHDQHISGPLRISVRRAYLLEDSYNQLRMRSPQDLKGRLNVQFQGEEGIDAGGLTREWYQLLSRVIFDKGALLFTTVGNDATFQPNPNSVYQTEHLSYFKFVGRMVAKALFDGQLLDVYFTRSFYKHILGVKVTYHDIEAVDPDYYKNLKWLLENDVNDILDLTFSMDADEEKHILYEKTEVTDYELKPGGRNIRVTEETKHEYVDLVAGHILTNAIRPQINAFLEGFNELIPRELVSIFNDKELELLISGLPEIDFDDLKANTEYTSYAAGSPVIHWFWEVVKAFSKEDMARFLQFVTGTSKVPLEGFKALQGISGPQRLQIHKAYGGPERLPSAHTCFNQLDLPEYPSKEQLQERLLLAIHEASEGFGFA